MAFQHIYDGKNTATVLPSGERLDRAQQGMNDLILNAEKLKLDSFKKNEEWFLKTQDVDLETFLSTANTDTQAKLIDEYNNQAKNILKSRGGDFNNLTTQDKLELAKGRKVLESEQQRMLGDLEKYKMAKSVVDKNPDYYDSEKFNEIIGSTYLKDGKFPDVELPIRGKSLGVILNTKKAEGTQTLDYGEPFDYNGRKVKQGTYYSASPDEAKEYVKNMIFSDPQIQVAAYAEFDALPEKEKMKYLSVYDTDKSGSISNTEAQSIPKQDSRDKSAYNPIVAYQQDKYWQQARGTREGTMTSAEKSTSTGQGDKYFIGGQWKKVTPGTNNAKPITLSGQTYLIPYEFDGTYKVSYIPTINARELSGTKGIKITDATNVEGYLKLYDANKNVFVFAATGTDPNIPSGTLIEVPADQLRDLDVKDFPVIDNGNKKTLQQVMANRSTAKAPTEQSKPKMVRQPDGSYKLQ